MRVDQLGSGEPEIAVVGGIHGDEPSGVHAVEQLMEQRPRVDRPVKLVVANEAAIEQGRRYVDEDLNRAFPGDPRGPTHESRLAAGLADEIAGCRTLAMHSTQSHPEPFAVISQVDQFARQVVPRLSVTAAVGTGEYVAGRLFATGGVIEIEAGLQGSEAAAENAVRLSREFLAAEGALREPREPQSVPLYRLRRTLPKDPADRYEVFVDNFAEVEPGQPYAAANGVEQVAEEAFYPVLLSARGYVDIFGYAAEHVGELP